MDPGFVNLLTTKSLTDIAMIRSVLDAGGVRYFIQGENMLYTRPSDPAVLMVAAPDADAALELLKPLKFRFQRISFGCSNP